MRQCVFLAAAVLAGAARADAPVASVAGQSIADLLSSAAPASIAFVPEGVLNATGKRDDLSSWLQFPADTVSVVKLTGKQVKAALERSVSLYPAANPSFLHVSGLDVVFDKDKPADKRIVSVTASGAPVSDDGSYEVAMPTSLAKGGAGYFLIWEKSAVTKTLKTTLGSITKGKPVQDGESRYKAGRG